MDAYLAVSPLAGAVIGYFTNYVAIKMLFRPYNQVKIGPIKVPFTPGLIPKEKERIAAALGTAVGEKILTGDTIKEYLLSPKMTDYVHDCINEKAIQLKNSQYTINDLGKLLKHEEWENIKDDLCKSVYLQITDILKSEQTISQLSDNIYLKINSALEKKAGIINSDNVLSFLEYIFNAVFSDLMENGKIQSVTEKAIWNLLLNIEKDQRTIKEAVSFATISELKDYLVLKVPDMVNAVISLTENPQIEETLKEHLKSALESIAGPFLGMFINTDDIYCKIITDVTEYFNNPENSGEIENVVSLAVENFTEKTVGDVASVILSQLREKTVNKMVMFMFNEFKYDALQDIFNESFKKYIAENSHKSLNDILTGIDNNFNSKLKEFVYNTVYAVLTNANEFINEESFKIAAKNLFNTKISSVLDMLKIDNESIAQTSAEVYKGMVFNFSNGFLSKLNISEMAEKRINTFEMGYLESIILSIAKKELSAITYLGGILGFIIGLVPSVLSIL